MAALKNQKHEAFAQAVSKLEPATSAYARIWGVSEKSAAESGSRLSKSVKVANRIAELQGKQSDKSEMSRDQLRKYLIEVLITPAGEVDKRHRLCQGYKDTMDSHEIKMPDKLAAAQQLAKLCGWNEPEKIDHGGDILESLLKFVRDGKEA